MADLSEQLDLSGAFERARNNIRDEMEEVADEGRDEMLRVIELRDAVATGDLKSSIQTYVRTLSRGVRATVGADAKPGSNIAPYAHFADQPTRPHFPPIRPLERWARVKFNDTGDEKTATAWAVARSISRRGTSGVRFTDAGLRAMQEGLVQRLEKAVAKALD